MIIRMLFLMITALSLAAGPRAAIHDLAPQQDPGAEFVVEFFPVAPYHVGDILSARVTYTGSDEIGGSEITIARADRPDQPLQTTTFSRFTRSAVFYWFLDTQGSDPGFLEFQFTHSQSSSTWTQGVQLLPDPGNRQATWAITNTPCCTLHYLTGTDAETDLVEITKVLEERSALALAQFAAAGVFEESPLEDPLRIVLIPIVVGHGGFATDEAVLTYSHWNWAGIEFEILAHHEIVHVIDRLVNTQGPRPSIFVEGLAVYLSGGHYREGDALQRAAALLELDMYLPMSDIVNDFYAAQHEIGYMQAAALVAYLDRLWGWETFIDFYFNLPEGPHDDIIISSALDARFGMDLAELETNFIAYLETLEIEPGVKEDVRLTVEIYDMLRRYQTLVIPSAHFRSAWWPPVRQMREEDIVGDYAYREKAPLNVIIEHYFLEVHDGLRTRDYTRAETSLAVIEDLLNRIENTGGLRSHYAIGWPLVVRPGLINRP
jgi:hypothetical protein